MPETLRATPLTADAFAPFGDVIALPDTPGLTSTQGLSQRHSDLAQLSHDPQGRMGISLFDAEPRALPYRLEMLERHPLGAQAFLPMTQNPFLVIVAPDAEGRPGPPRAFLTAPGQGVNYHRGTWHGVLTPLHAPGLFAVVDRIGPGQNIAAHWLDQPLTIN